jgi:hypothetical protein
MKQTLALLAITILAGCASAPASSDGAPPLQVTLLQRGTAAPDVYYFRGPVNIQYDLAVKNPTNDQYTLKRLDIQSIGQGSYRIRTGSQPMNQKIDPNGTTSVHLSTWGQSTGGFISSGEPVSVRVIAQFAAPNGKSFQKVFTETLSQFGQ